MGQVIIDKTTRRYKSWTQNPPFLTVDKETEVELFQKEPPALGQINDAGTWRDPTSQEEASYKESVKPQTTKDRESAKQAVLDDPAVAQSVKDFIKYL